MPNDERIFLGLGSNIDDRYQYLKRGIQLLKAHPHIWVLNKSHVYESAAMYNLNQEEFYNMVIEIDTNLIPIELLNEVKIMEDVVGRDLSKAKNMPRKLDIDILSIGNMQIESSVLNIPHSKIHERKFVLKPWRDIAPNHCLPGSSASITELLQKLDDPTPVRMVLILDKEESN